MDRCPKCGAPAGPSAPDGDFRYIPPTYTPADTAAEKRRIAARIREIAQRRLESKPCYKELIALAAELEGK